MKPKLIGIILLAVVVLAAGGYSIYRAESSVTVLHGYLGAELLRSHGMNRLARVCERHTGTGLTPEQIAAQQLPLPPGSYVPETPEEQLLCYADKFYSKSHPERERTVAQTAVSLEKFGHDGVAKFLAWAERFEPELPKD